MVMDSNILISLRNQTQFKKQTEEAQAHSHSYSNLMESSLIFDMYLSVPSLKSLLMN